MYFVPGAWFNELLLKREVVNPFILPKICDTLISDDSVGVVC